MEEAMVYRKGERPVAKVIRPYDADHPVASGIADGDHWMDAWLGQMCTPWDAITRKTGITRPRIEELNDDAEPTVDEIEKLAALWYTTPEGLRKSIDEANDAQ
ncbi:hypothetical protein [Sphingopyxis sp.]|jgi:hypothetical protein|uniref:hypothetical protein n=1 Tax=Sphingopyxis sp. TaxID=1908224 RepID=UPI002DED351E|nr:hypothetical protein [Sphingopyxis sp.]